MALFGGKKEPVFPGVLGIDFGTTAIKVVEIVPEKGRPHLSTYGYAEQSMPSPAPWEALKQADATAATLKDILKEAGMRSTKVVAALPSSQVFHAIISLPVPKSSKDDLRPLIEAQAEKLLPLPVAEMVLDSNVLDKDLLPTDTKAAPDVEDKTSAGKYLRVLVTAAPRALISDYVTFFKRTGLELVALETETFAVQRSIAGKEKSCMMIVDVGGTRSSVVIVDGGIPVLTRNVKGGGVAVTSALAAAMGVSFDEAESMKRDLASTSGDDMPPALELAMKPILHEMRYALESYRESSGKNIEKLLVTGGGAQLPGLQKHIASTLNVNAYVADSWAFMGVPEGSRPVLDEVGGRFAVAAGLALRGEKP